MECWSTLEQNLELKEILDSIQKAKEEAAEKAAQNPWYAPQVIGFILAPHLYFWPTVIFASTGVLPWGLAFHPAVAMSAFWFVLYFKGNRQGEHLPTIPDEQVDMNLPELPETSTLLFEFLNNTSPLFILAGYLVFWLIFLIRIQ